MVVKFCLRQIGNNLAVTCCWRQVGAGVSDSQIGLARGMTRDESGAFGYTFCAFRGFGRLCTFFSRPTYVSCSCHAFGLEWKTSSRGYASEPEHGFHSLWSFESRPFAGRLNFWCCRLFFALAHCVRAALCHRTVASRKYATALCHRTVALRQRARGLGFFFWNSCPSAWT